MCFGALRDHVPAGADDNRFELDMPEGSTAADVLERIGAPRRLAAVILQDGETIDLDLPLADGCELTLMPPFSGGSLRIKE